MIRFEGIRKRFGRVDALRGVSAIVPRGRVTALVGPNGSGKTTLMKCLLGLVRADGGTIRLEGASPDNPPDLRELIGYSPQMPRFPENLTVAELLALIAGVRHGAGASPETAWGRDSLFDMEALGPRRLRGLSGGTLQKVGAELAWRSGAPLLVLDEPTAGLDPLSSSHLKDRLLADRRAGRTVLISSHVLADLQELADHIIFLLEGQVCYEGPLAELLARTGEDRLERAVATLMREAT